MPEKLDFITPTFLKVLYLFHENPMHEIHEREVVRRTGISKGSANKVFRKLSEIVVLKRNKRGRMFFYSLNTKSALARQFKILFNVYSLNDLINGIKPYCKRIILFGSCSEGMDVKESDIDLFVLTNEKKKVWAKISVYQNKLERKMAPIIVNANEL